MTKEELTRREKSLQAAGYRKSTATSSSNDYSWFKTIRLDEERDSDYTYIIEWRVWNWIKYRHHDPSVMRCPYSMELVVLVNGECNTRIECNDNVSVEEGEKLAAYFHEFAMAHNLTQERKVATSDAKVATSSEKGGNL